MVMSAKGAPVALLSSRATVTTGSEFGAALPVTVGVSKVALKSLSSRAGVVLFSFHFLRQVSTHTS
jgi:hypothetical protein